MKKYIVKFIPDFILKKILGVIRSIMRAHWEMVNAKIPKLELKQEHIANAKIILDRVEMLRLLPKNAVVAELGVNKGAFSEKILEVTDPKKFHIVDLWGSKRYNQQIRKSVEDKFSKEISEKKVEVNLGLSTDVAETFEDNYFDWIYIDTDHSYQITIEELEAYRSKMKKGGIITGHDYIVGNWVGMVRFGVIEAVYEFCLKYDWEILYITMENEENPSFAIRERNVTPL